MSVRLVASFRNVATNLKDMVVFIFYSGLVCFLPRERCPIDPSPHPSLSSHFNKKLNIVPDPPLQPQPRIRCGIHHHHLHRYICASFGSFYVLVEGHFIHEGQYLPNLDSIFGRRAEHQSVIHPSAPHALSSGWEIDQHDSTAKVWALFNNCNVL